MKNITHLKDSHGTPWCELGDIPDDEESFDEEINDCDCLNCLGLARQAVVALMRFIDNRIKSFGTN